MHVADLADAIVRAVGAPRVPGRTFYVNHPEVVTSRALVTAIGGVQGRRVRIVPLPESVARVALGTIGAAAAFRRRNTSLRYDKANDFYQEAWTADEDSLPMPTDAAVTDSPDFSLDQILDRADWGKN